MKPERSNEWVKVSTRVGDVKIPWATRQELLDRLRARDDARAVVDAFEAVGTSVPVTLDDSGKGVLLGVVRDWVSVERSDGVPAGILELRNRLADDLGFVT